MEEIKWRLEDIYPDQERWEQDLTGAKQQIADYGRYRGHLGDSGKALLEALQVRDRIQEICARIYNYASMRFDSDTTDPVAQALRDRAMSLETEAQAAASFMAPELLALPEQTIGSFLNDPGLAVYRFELDDLLRYRSHTLSPAEEEIIARAGETLQAPDVIFKMIDNADLTFDPIKGEDGRETPVTRGNYSVLMQSADRRVRQDAFNSLYSAYRKLSNTLSATLTAGVKRDQFLAGTHHYRSSLDAALHEENVAADVYDNLIGAVRSHLALLHRYMELCRRALKVAELHMYDIYAPLTPGVEWPVSFPSAVQIVEQGLAPLGQDYVEALSRGLQAGWVDVPERPGKAGGAYCEGVYGVHPFVLLNYHENIDNAFTLAHEMGHAMHFYYSGQEQPFIYAMPTIFTAEVASTVNETLLMEHLLQTEGDRQRRLYLLGHYLELFRGTIFRQTMFAEFEKAIHQKAESGEAVTSNYLQQIYRQLNLDYHGPLMKVDREIDLEWARIPHFYSAFYVYKYATGLSAAVALVQGILQEGRPALDRYRDFLKRGNSDYPLNLLRLAGVDMSRPEPVNQALERFGQLLGELERSL
jgi:oligoendopeptidase F